MDSYSGIIYMAREGPMPFYVVLTNVSKEPQLAFETWNEWGYRTISFEARTEDGHTVAISMKPHGFRANFPSTFLIAPSEHMVYPITLDSGWETVPQLPRAALGPMKISIKAIYEVKPTPESAKAKVWTGRTESKTYDFNLERYPG